MIFTGDTDEFLLFVNSNHYPDAVLSEFTLHGNDALHLYKIKEEWYFHGIHLPIGCNIISDDEDIKIIVDN
jgi:hypothetical protein